ncbi:hypothetical protein N9D43_00905 [Luminiphilus sp.]|nr:hypothetical protein [Luminiphilus sp.]
MKLQKLKGGLIFGLTILIMGCASAPVIEVEPFDTVATVENDFDTTWSKLIRFASTNQIGIKTIEKASGLIIFENTSMSPNLILQYCTNINVGMLAALDSGSASGNVTVVDEGGFSTVSANMQFKATTKFCYEGCQYSTNICDSLGKFETDLLDAVR